MAVLLTRTHPTAASTGVWREQIASDGYRVLRVTWAQAIAQPGRTLRRFWDAKAPRAVDGSASR